MFLFGFRRSSILHSIVYEVWKLYPLPGTGVILCPDHSWFSFQMWIELGQNGAVGSVEPWIGIILSDYYITQAYM